jgi:microcystin-dependent protein
MLRKTLLGLTAGASALFCANAAQAQDFYLGQIITGGWNFCPRGTAAAQGQLMSIAQNNALFALYGTTYGGDGVSTFGLPDTRGRTPVHLGKGPGLSNYDLGQAGGTEDTTLSVAQMASHTHIGTVRGTNNPGDIDNPANAQPADFPDASTIYNTGTVPAINFTAGTVVLQPQGGSQPFSNLDPFLTIRYCVVLQGLFPPQG